jgi:glycine cleavage system H protein
MNPEKLLYTKTHEWVEVSRDAAGAPIATVGLSSFALEALTDLVFLDLPEVGRKVEAGKPLGEVESVKAVSDVNSPVDGQIVEVNRGLADNLEHLPEDPYGAGWLAKIKVAGEAGLKQLMDYAAYRKHCEQEAKEH